MENNCLHVNWLNLRTKERSNSVVDFARQKVDLPAKYAFPD